MRVPLRRRLSKALRNNEFAWRHVLNREAVRTYRASRPALGPVEAAVVADLDRQGIALTNASALLGSTASFEELARTVQEEEARRRAEIAALRAAADQGQGGEKTFLVELLGRCPELDPKSVYARFALQKPMLRVANAYFGMHARLRHYNVWHNVPTQSAPRASQLWHRDREDYLILKAFVYLSNVTRASGALNYAPSTHRKGSISGDAEHFVEGDVRRSTDEQMARMIPPSAWVEATGQPGTIAFVDTRGYHKGGLARDGDRLIYVAVFTSPASESEELLKRPPSLSLPADREVTFALAERPVRRYRWLPF